MLTTLLWEIDVAEQKTGSVTVGAGYSQSDGLVGIVGLSGNESSAVRATRWLWNWEFGGKTHSNKKLIPSRIHILGSIATVTLSA